MSAPAAEAAPIRDAATLVLLRDAPGGPQVLMLKRHGESAVLGNTYVFPGGKVDAADAQLDARHLDVPADELRARLGEPALDADAASALHVAALRETFEEAGLLLAGGTGIDAMAQAHARLAGGAPFHALLGELGLRLNVSALAPWSRWITPRRSQNKRFDTRFFVARAPEGDVRHDGRETTEAVWLRPRDALQTYWDGRMALVPPQIMTLAHLSRHASVDAVLAEARARLPALVEPHILGDGGARVMCYPGDPEHGLRERAMPGPLRLFVRDARYEPASGFDGFFS